MSLFMSQRTISQQQKESEMREDVSGELSGPVLCWLGHSKSVQCITAAMMPGQVSTVSGVHTALSASRDNSQVGNSKVSHYCRMLYSYHVSIV